MPEPQAVLTPLTEAAMFMVATIDEGGEGTARELLADAAGLKRSVGFRIPDGPRPAELHPFRELAGARHTAVSTPADLLFHIRAHRFDLCFELAQRITGRLAGCGRVVDEVHGFRSFDERDLLGFVDGTENPEGLAARAAVTVGDEDPEFAGGSYVIVQKYLHDLASWDALAVEDQELAVGRTKLSDIELPDEVKPSNSHVALNTIVGQDGEERQIMRFNMPFGAVGRGEFGTYFIGYASTPEVIEQMLTNMFIGKPPGNYDRLLDFSQAVTGSLFYVPAAEFLDDPPSPGGPVGAAAGAAPAGAAAVAAPADADGSLGIGALR
jgi:porphyrinogen peroxidase